jgi:YggT family protein
VRDLVCTLLNLLWIVLFVQAILSWVNPYAPAAPVFDAITRPFLRPLQRWIAPVGRFDLTPLILLLVLWIVLFLIDGLTRAAARL